MLLEWAVISAAVTPHIKKYVTEKSAKLASGYADSATAKLYKRLFTMGEYHCIDVAFEDKTAMHLVIEPTFTLETDYADWKTGDWRPLKKWPLIHSQTNRLLTLIRPICGRSQVSRMPTCALGACQLPVSSYFRANGPSWVTHALKDALAALVKSIASASLSHFVQQDLHRLDLLRQGIQLGQFAL